MKKIANPPPTYRKPPPPPPPPPPLPRLSPKPLRCQIGWHSTPNTYGQCTRCGEGGLPKVSKEVPMPPVKPPKQDEHLARLKALEAQFSAIHEALAQQEEGVRRVLTACEELLDSPELRFARALNQRGQGEGGER